MHEQARTCGTTHARTASAPSGPITKDRLMRGSVTAGETKKRVRPAAEGASRYLGRRVRNGWPGGNTVQHRRARTREERPARALRARDSRGEGAQGPGGTPA